MSKKENEKSQDELCEDSLFDASQVVSPLTPSGVDRRNFLMRSAVVGAAAVMTGRLVSAKERTLTVLNESVRTHAPATPPLSNDLEVVKKGKGPVMTTIDEFYKVGPGPSSSHTIGPMRITNHFYQPADKITAAQLAKT